MKCEKSGMKNLKGGSERAQALCDTEIWDSEVVILPATFSVLLKAVRKKSGHMIVYD